MMLRTSARRCNRGAAAAELGVVIFIVFLLFLGMIDLCRVLSAKVVATTAAQEGLELAQRIPGLAVDHRTCARGDSREGITPSSPNYFRCAQFDGARDEVLTAAQRKPLATLMDPSSAKKSGSKLVPFLFPNSTGGGQPLKSDAALLMPGDFARAKFSKGEKVFTNPVGQPLPPNLPWSEVLYRYPMIVHVCFEMTPVVGSLFGRWTSCGMATGYRIAATPPAAQSGISVSTFAAPPTTLPPATTTSTVPPLCPNGTCDVGENCFLCPPDCGACCGNGFCGDPGEDCATCAADCGCLAPSVCVGGTCSSAFGCGNGSCDGGENCASCPGDCGVCATTTTTFVTTTTAASPTTSTTIATTTSSTSSTSQTTSTTISQCVIDRGIICPTLTGGRQRCCNAYGPNCTNFQVRVEPNADCSTGYPISPGGLPGNKCAFCTCTGPRC